MDASVIEHGNDLPPRGRRNSVAADLLARLPELGDQDNIFYEEHDKDRQRRLYNALYMVAKRHNMSITVRFYDDGLRVWKVEQ
jgi:hypothetical protein